MASNITILQIVALVITAICAVIDFRTTKIPNLITFPATLLGLGLQTYFFGVDGLIDGVAGAVVGVAITVLPKLKKDESIGFGDAKLMMALGAMLGWIGILLIWFYFSLVWGLIALYRFMSAFPIKTIIGSLLSKSAGGTWFTPETTAKIQKKMQTPIPLAPAIFVGVLLAVLLGPGTLEFMGFTNSLPRSAKPISTAQAPAGQAPAPAPDQTK